MWHDPVSRTERLDSVRYFLKQCPRALRNAYAMCIVLIGWVLFRADSLAYATAFIGRMLGIGSGSSQLIPMTQLATLPMLTLMVGAAILTFPVWPTFRPLWLGPDERGSGSAARDILRASYVASVMVLSLATMAANQQNPFLYFRFW